MTTIRGFLQLIKDEKNLTSKQKSFISISLTELDRTHTIINDFLSLAKPTSNDHSKINISEQIYDVVDFMIPFTTLSNVYIHLNCIEDIYIEGSAKELKQLMINILKNGIEAMHFGGDLFISALSYENMVRITIQDQGVGMSEQQINELGKPYYFTKAKGTGLGLMITFDIIKRMNGTYQIESKENHGTCFTIQFPQKG